MMRVRGIVSYLDRQREPANSDPEALAEWLSLADVPRFLTDSVEGQMPAYLSGDHFYLYSVLVPESALVGDYVQDLMSWDFGPSGGWGYGSAYDGGEASKAIYPPLSSTGTRLPEGTEALFFLREFEGVRTYPEMSQRASHLLCLHWEACRGAYCKLDDNADLWEVATARRDDDWLVCTLERTELDFYMYLTDSALVRFFDVERCQDWTSSFDGPRTAEQVEKPEVGIAARRVAVQNENGEPVLVWLRGFQLVRRSMTDNECLARLTARGEMDRPHESFIAFDFKHGEVRECSCNPSELGNYFVESELPFSTSPAFFRPEVLAKYKQDPDKYRVRTGRIDCRAGWSVRYDVNEEGQVHAYLCDLGRLPHSEQLYWKSFNEPPKAWISERALKTDFLAEWDDSYDPLISLKQRLQAFPAVVVDSEELQIWVPDEDSLNRLGYVVTGSRKEWEDQVLVLAKLVVDGLGTRELTRLAKSLACYDESVSGKSLKLLKACLMCAGVSADTTQDIVGPLYEVWNLRSEGGVAHRGTSAVPADPLVEWRRLLSDVDQAVGTLAKVIDERYLDPSRK